MSAIGINSSNAAEVARTVAGGAVVGPATVRRSPSITALAGAMVKVQSEIEDPTKNKRADAGTKVYRYADLPTVLDAVRPVLARHGLAVMQFPCELDGHAALMTLLVHGTSGEWVETVARLREVKNDPQAIGSAQTYTRRYALLALCGVAADDDDDGKAGSTPARRQEHPPAANGAAPGQLGAPFVLANRVARLTQGYATAATPGDFEGLEATRKEIWAQLNPDHQKALKAAAVETQARLGLVPAAAK